MSGISVEAGKNADDVRSALAPIFHYFGVAPPDEAARNFVTLMTPQRMLLAREGDAVVGGCGSFPFQLTTPGGRLATAGLSMVGVVPTHRRRGILTAMMRRTIEDCRARDEAAIYLWASDERIYGRFGFGMTGLSADIAVSRDRAALLGSPPREAAIRRVPLGEAYEPLSAVFAQVAAVTPGAFARTPDWWRLKTLADPAWRRRGGGEMQCAVVEMGGKPDAYALYRMNFDVERGTQRGATEVIEAVGASPNATRAIWSFLLEMDWTASITASFLPLDHPLILSALEPRRLDFRQRDGAWLRLIDLERALNARAYGPGEIVLEIEDALCPSNAGRWRVSADGAARTSASADIQCGVAALACAYLGGFSWRQLVAASRAFANTDDAVVRADRVFESRGAPWCPEIF